MLIPSTRLLSMAGAVLFCGALFGGCLPYIQYPYTTHDINATSTGQAALVARHGPAVYGRMLSRGQVGISASANFDTPTQSQTTRMGGAPANRVPRWSGGGAVQFGVAENTEFSLSATAASSADSVPIASDGGAMDPLQSGLGESTAALRYRYRLSERFIVIGGAEFGIQFYPSFRTVTERNNAVTHFADGSTQTDALVHEFRVRSTTIGPLLNIFGSVVAEPIRWLQFELGLSAGGFTSSRGVGYASNNSCFPCMLSQTDSLGIEPGAAATGWFGTTVGSGPIQGLLRATATASPESASTGSIWGANATVRVVFGGDSSRPSVPTQTPAPRTVSPNGATR